MTEQTLQAKKDFSRIGFSLLIIGVVTTIVQIVLMTIWNLTAANSPLGQLEIMQWILTFAPLYLVGAPLGLLLMKKVPAEQMPVQKPGAKNFWRLMCICIPIMYGGNLVGTFLSMFLSGGTASNALLDYVMGNPLYSIIFAVILAPIVEEYIFRKQLIDRLGKYGEKTAVFFSALTFGLFHMNLFQFFYAFGLGLIFAYTYTRTRSLRYSIIMHMAINFLGSVVAPLLLSVLDMDAVSSLESGTATVEQIARILPGLAAFGLYFMALMGSVVTGIVFLAMRWGRHQFLEASCELPAKGSLKTVYGNTGMILFTIFCLVMTVLSLF